MTRKQKISSLIAGSALAITGSVFLTQPVENKSLSAPIQHTSAWKEVSPGGYYNYSLQPGDTMYLKPGEFTYISFGNVHGTKEKPIVIYSDRATLKNGFEFHDCDWFKIIGVKVNSHNSNPSNRAFNIEGRSNHFEIYNVTVDSAQYFITFKTEAQEHPTDSTYWSITQDDIYVHDSYFNYAKQDGFYFGSTNTKADRAVTYQGKVYYPRACRVSNCRMERCFIKNTQRTAVQISNSSGVNYVKNCRIESAGFEYSLSQWPGSLYQGAGIAFGGNNYGYFEASSNIIKNTLLNNIYSYACGHVVIKNNLLDSADICWNFKNPQVNASMMLVTNCNTKLQVSNNLIGWNNSNTKIVTYGTNLSDSSFICNSGLLTNNSSYDFGKYCYLLDTIPDEDTIPQDTIVIPPADSSIREIKINWDSSSVTFYKNDNTQTTIYNIKRINVAIRPKRFVIKMIGSDSAIQVK